MTDKGDLCFFINKLIYLVGIKGGVLAKLNLLMMKK